MIMQIPSDVFLNVFGYLHSKEIYPTINLISKQSNAIVERNVSRLPKKKIEGHFETNYYATIKWWKVGHHYGPSNEHGLDEISLFWNERFILQDFHIYNLPYHFGTLIKLYETYAGPMAVEKLTFHNTQFPATDFAQEYDNLASIVQPINVKWRNVGRSLADLKFLRTSKFFRTKSIETLEVCVELPRRRPFEGMSFEELVEFVSNADDNKKSKKTLMIINWNFMDADNRGFAEKLVQKFVDSQEPKQFFREIYSSYEGPSARAQWFDFFTANAIMKEIYRDDDRFINKNRIVYEISRKDGWTIALDAQVDGNTAFYVYYVSGTENKNYVPI